MRKIIYIIEGYNKAVNNAFFNHLVPLKLLYILALEYPPKVPINTNINIINVNKFPLDSGRRTPIILINKEKNIIANN